MRGQVDTTLFRKNVNQDFVIIQIYVYDIIFGATNEELHQDFSIVMQDELKCA